MARDGKMKILTDCSPEYKPVLTLFIQLLKCVASDPTSSDTLYREWFFKLHPCRHSNALLVLLSHLKNKLQKEGIDLEHIESC